MARSLSLRSLLDSDKFMGSNFDNWYRKLRVVLELEKILYMIMDLVPKVLTLNTNTMVRDTYQKWLNDCTIVYYIVRVAMSNKFSCKVIDTQSKEIL